MGPLDELRAAVRPADTDRVVPLSPYRINERLQALAARAGLEDVDRAIHDAMGVITGGAAKNTAGWRADFGGDHRAESVVSRLT